MTDVQERILNIYNVIRAICIKNDIRFYAIGGTSIGAERHHGFIPWDDDLDIAIPNSDYKKFIELCKKELPDEYELFLPQNSPHSLIYWGKVHDKRTAFLEEANFKYKDYKYGVFVDIMPMYGIPEDINWYNRRIKRYRTLSSFQRNCLRQFGGKKKIIALVLKPINIFFPKDYWLKKLEEFQSRFDFDKCENVGYTWHILNKKRVFKRKWFDNYYDLPFENSLMRCCSGNKEMLTKQFGNYMEMPPESERVSNHFVKVIDLYHSYVDYDDKGELRK